MISMAATIVADVCEDHQDYELMEPSATENLKRVNRSLTPKKTYLNISQALFHTHTVGPYG